MANKPDKDREQTATDQAWFWSAEWQKMEREADEDIAAGRVIFFEDGKALIEATNNVDEVDVEPSPCNVFLAEYRERERC